MKHSEKYEFIKEQYELNQWTKGKKGWSKNMVRNAVKKGWIRPDEYFEITGEPYE